MLPVKKVARLVVNEESGAVVQFAVPTDQLSITYYIDRNIYNATSGSLVIHLETEVTLYLFL